MSNHTIATAEALTKTYRTGAQEYKALRGVSLTLQAGEFSMLAGPSGCGKTTLLSILGGVLHPSSGTVNALGLNLHDASDQQLDDYRLGSIGFIFQGHNLLGALTAEDNVAVMLELRGAGRSMALQEARRLLTAVRLGDKCERRPHELSIGERQRVAIARALAGNPPLILADEPTASLDASNGAAVMELLRDIARRENRTVLTVTHDSRIFALADRVLHMEDGELKTQ
jgi:putative ABC transport system ATP-binding protein